MEESIVIVENLVYNCSGREYWGKLYHEDYERLCFYERHHGKYVGEIVDQLVSAIMTEFGGVI